MIFFFNSLVQLARNVGLIKITRVYPTKSSVLLGVTLLNR